MFIHLLSNANNSAHQATLERLLEDGHTLTNSIWTTEDAVMAEIRAADPDLIIAPFLQKKVSSAIHGQWPTIVIHPGPPGDGGPSSLDRAIDAQVSTWGVTALQAEEDLDAGPIHAFLTFPLPRGVRKTVVYTALVVPAAARLASIVAGRIEAGLPRSRSGICPTPYQASAGTGPFRQAERAFTWDAPTDRVVASIAAADGRPGVLTELGGRAVRVFGARPHDGAASLDIRPGVILGHHGRGVLVATADGAVSVSHTQVPGAVAKAPVLLGALTSGTPGPASSVRSVEVRSTTVITLDAYNGAMSAAISDQLAQAVQVAERAEATSNILITGGPEGAWSNGIDLCEIQLADGPAAAGRASIQAINRACRAILTCAKPVTVALTGNTGAGGVFLALCGDQVLAPPDQMANPFYHLGLSGSELHTLTLPTRVGQAVARQLLQQRLPIGAVRAARIGLLDQVGPAERRDFDAWAIGQARTTDARPRFSSNQIATAEEAELQRMHADLFDDAQGHAAAREAFLTKAAPCRTPDQLVGPLTWSDVPGGCGRPRIVHVDRGQQVTTSLA